MFNQYCDQCKAYHQPGIHNQFPAYQFTPTPTPINNHYHSGLTPGQFENLMKKLDEVLEAISNLHGSEPADTHVATQSKDSEEK